MSSKPTKIFETTNGIFVSSVPSGYEKRIVAEHDAASHSFQASMEVTTVADGKFYLKDLKTDGRYVMTQSNFVAMVKQSNLIKGMITARWGWTWSPSSVSIVFCEQVDE